MKQMLSFETLDSIADSVNPICGVVAFLVPWVKRRRRARAALTLNALTIVAVGLAYLLQALDGATNLWSRLGLDYSTHTAVFIAIASSIWQHGIPWRWSIAGIGLAYAILMRVQDYHSVLDIVSTGAVIVPLLILFWWRAGGIGRSETLPNLD